MEGLISGQEVATDEWSDSF